MSRPSYWAAKSRRLLKPALVAILMIAVVAACSGKTPQSREAILSNSQSAADVRAITHAMGETRVPVNPQRVVALLGSLDNILALGVNPIGSADVVKPYLEDRAKGIESVGNDLEPNLETILALKPDMILGLALASEVSIYGKLSQIAPTVLAPSEHSGEWKEVLMKQAEALGKTEKAEQMMTDYYTRLEKFKAQMGDRLNQIQVSVVRVYPESINLYLKDSFCGTVLQDAGLSRPPSQDLDAAAAKFISGNSIQLSISKELLEQADGDVIFLWTTGSNQEIAQQAKTALARLKADPLWSQLKAVKQGKVYEVPGYWIGDGPLAANAVIDDLFKYLVPSEEQQLDKE
ncbi:iron-siderophore ABC transporter substrate-binding protein [Chroococcidiopsis sp. CCMEE 29]|uniref:ABC transporter substrate-binding protein n=1 Tax=Chroococcidiopsis sp. CCMEE 29 TaxID=155894 RepID=UPI0020227E55|nr:iron-siderophore ABC transporter substrate-binding protein [Chroococcidiopsis sp. CCMEE 29]